MYIVWFRTNGIPVRSVNFCFEAQGNLTYIAFEEMGDGDGEMVLKGLAQIQFV